jgi:hypothetical protein
VTYEAHLPVDAQVIGFVVGAGIGNVIVASAIAAGEYGPLLVFFGCLYCDCARRRAIDVCTGFLGGNGAEGFCVRPSQMPLDKALPMCWRCFLSRLLPATPGHAWAVRLGGPTTLQRRAGALTKASCRGCRVRSLQAQLLIIGYALAHSSSDASVSVLPPADPPALPRDPRSHGAHIASGCLLLVTTALIIASLSTGKGSRH